MFEMRFEHRHELQPAGGMTQSIFAEAERLLMSETDFQRALRFVASRKNMNRYRSMLDFLFCEIFIDWRDRCFAYYDDETRPRLKDLIDEKQRALYDRWLVAALTLAREKLELERVASWTRFRSEVLRLAA